VNRRSEHDTQPQTLRDRFKETAAQAIIDAAEEVFADAGLHAARMDAIAARAGVSVGTLYNYFKDRESLLAGVLEAKRRELFAALDGAVAAGAGRPFSDRLRGLVVALLEHAERHRKFLRIVLQAEVGRNLAAHAPSKTPETMAALTERIDKVVKSGVRDKALRPEMADLAGILLLGMVRALILRTVTSGGDGGLVHEADRVVDAFLHGLGTPGGGRHA